MRPTKRRVIPTMIINKVNLGDWWDKGEGDWDGISEDCRTWVGWELFITITIDAKMRKEKIDGKISGETESSKSSDCRTTDRFGTRLDRMYKAKWHKELLSD